jgi:CheY-like chemotaxis protein/nitrogen-specific signal transduction histidine kinase
LRICVVSAERSVHYIKGKREYMGTKRCILYSHLLTSKHRFFRSIREIAKSFGYDVLITRNDQAALQYMGESGGGALFCDDRLCNGDFLAQLKNIAGIDKRISLFLIIEKSSENTSAFEKEIDGYLPLSLTEEVYESYFFNIFKHISTMERLKDGEPKIEVFSGLTARTDPEFVKLLIRRTAHAVNNILTGMQGYSELAQMHPEDKKLISDTFDVVFDSSQRIRNEIKNLRAFVGVENPRVDQVSIARVIGESISLIRTSIRARRIDLVKRSDHDLLISGDHDQLIQVFFNLLNVIMLTCVEDCRIELAISYRGNMVAVSIVGDNCEEDTETFESLKRILSFDIPVFEEEDSGGRIEGHEVLAICNRIVHNHGGKIDVHREERKKLLFTVTLPVLSVSSEPLDIEKVLLKPAYDTINNLDIDILVVDDEEYVRNTLYYFFDSKGCKVTLAEDGEYGLQIAKKKQFDLVFMDYLMPKMGGIESARKIREGNRDVKIVFITGRESLDEEQLYRAGIYACIKKPFEIKELYIIAKKVALERGQISVR